MEASNPIASILLLVLLFTGMIFDLRNRTVPMPLTLGGLAFSALFALYHQLWFPVLLTTVLIVLSDVQPKRRRLIFALALTIAAVIVQPDAVTISVAILIVWSMWELRLLGGADAKLMIAITLFFGSPTFLLPVAVAGGIQGFIAHLRNQRTIPFVVSIFFGTMLYVIAPNI